MHEAVEHGVRHRGVDEQTVSLADRHLTCDQGGTLLGPVVDHLEEIVLGLTFKWGETPVVEDEEVHSGEGDEDEDVVVVTEHHVLMARAEALEALGERKASIRLMEDWLLRTAYQIQCD